MANELIHDVGCGPEIEGTRITVYNLLPHFLDPDATEASICRRYDLTPEQVAAARAYVLNEPWHVVLGNYLQIEARIAAGNPPEVVEKAERTLPRFLEIQGMAGSSRDGRGRRSSDRRRDEIGPAQFPKAVDVQGMGPRMGVALGGRS